MNELPKYLEVYVMGEDLRSIQAGIRRYVYPGAVGARNIRCILTPVPDHGFVPGDRVRYEPEGDEWTVCGWFPGTRGIVAYSKTHGIDHLEPYSCTRIDPDPPEERTPLTEEQIERVRDALKLEWHGYGNDLSDRVLARLREGER